MFQTGVLNFGHSSFGLVSNFGFRISDFYDAESLESLVEHAVPDGADPRRRHLRVGDGRLWPMQGHWLPENINAHGGVIDNLFMFIL